MINIRTSSLVAHAQNSIVKGDYDAALIVLDDIITQAAKVNNELTHLHVIYADFDGSDPETIYSGYVRSAAYAACEARFGSVNTFTLRDFYSYENQFIDLVGCATLVLINN